MSTLFNMTAFTWTRSLWNQYEIDIGKPYVHMGPSGPVWISSALWYQIGPLMKVISHGTILFKFEPVCVTRLYPYHRARNGIYMASPALRIQRYKHTFQYDGFASLMNSDMMALLTSRMRGYKHSSQYFGNNLLEPFESIFIGSTWLTMTFIWLRQPCKYGGTSTLFYMMEQFDGMGYEHIFLYDGSNIWQ